VLPTPYLVEVSGRASRNIRNLPLEILPTIAMRISQLAGNPPPVGVKKLSAKKGTYRIRVGGYRIMCKVNDQERVVTVLDVNIRGEIYKKR
jgi:mRNA interferase RelE/StbE